jgi:peptidoglycan/LPS O-acetylase OafA/YrhL
MRSLRHHARRGPRSGAVIHSQVKSFPILLRFAARNWPQIRSQRHVSTITQARRLDVTSTSSDRTGFRPDIQGLRAVAVAGVLIYHLWPGQLQGGFVGVDVFFVISGFLITSHLMRKPPRRFADFAAFWARRVRRLLPAALLVLGATTVVTLVIVPQTAWVDTERQVAAASVSVQNWALAFDSVDYLAAENAPTAVQHFWSLSVEEQFYLVWPLLIAGLVALGTLCKRPRRIVLIGIGAVVIGSFGYSVWLTANDPALAYFVTPTRIWELGLGGLIGVIAGERKPDSGPVASLIAWVGLLGIVAALALIDPRQPFPGALAAWPVVATALVLWANASARHSPLGLLSLRPVQFLGDISYSVYLWHWPLIVLLPFLIDAELDNSDRIVIIVATVLLAWVTYVLVETRLRAAPLLRSNLRAFTAAALAVAIVGGSGLAIATTAAARAERATAAARTAIDDPTRCVGAAVLAADAAERPECRRKGYKKLIQDPSSAKEDKSRAYADGCWANYSTADVRRPTCTYGHGPIKVALIGNSHAGMWLPALEKLAEDNGWTITTYLMSYCNVLEIKVSVGTPERDENCQLYGRWANKQVEDGAYDLVITSERHTARLPGHNIKGSREAVSADYTKIINRWLDSDAKVLVLRDIPRPSRTVESIPDCVAQYGPADQACRGTPITWDSPDPLAAAAEAMDDKDLLVIDPEPYFCPGGRCRAVIGGLITYFDASHVTASYARSMTGILTDEMGDFAPHD